MKLGEYFRTAIEKGDWEKVCNVYRQITGQYIEPPKPKEVLADVDMSNWEAQDQTQPSSPADIEMPTTTEDKWVEEGEEEPAQTLPVEESQEVQQASPPANPNRQPTVDDFRVDRSQGTNDSDGRRQARREVVSLGKRQNKFGDDQQLHMNESVKDHPELGVKNPTPRNKRPKIDPSVLDSAAGNVAALAGADTGQKINVVCSLCDKTDSVPVALAVGWHRDKPGTPIRDRENTYKCNECQTPAGRAKLLRKQRNG